MHKTLGSEIVLQAVTAPRKRSHKQIFRAAGAGVLSAAMVGIFALPVYAAVEPLPDAETAHAQLLSTVSSSSIEVPSHLPSAEEEIIVVEVPEIEEEEEIHFSSYNFDIPAGAGAAGIVNAAYAQLGIGQDCTDLVQNSLSALGIVAPRLQGGPDLGTGVGTWAQFGYQVSDGNYAPGDILIWPGYHVAIYVGDGMAIHGGWTNGGRHAESTVLTGAFATGAPSAVVRVG